MRLDHSAGKRCRTDQHRRRRVGRNQRAYDCDSSNDGDRDDNNCDSYCTERIIASKSTTCIHIAFGLTATVTIAM